MPRIRELFFRLQPFWRRNKIESGLSEEIQSHIDMATEANIAAGMSPNEARYAALREFGGVEQIKERYRDERGIRWIEELLSDIRFAARSLRKAPGFTTVAVLTLALCIGANSAVFSVVHAVLLKPYPWPESERLVLIHNGVAQTGRGNCSVPEYLDRRKGVTAFEESALWTAGSFNLAVDGAPPERVHGLTVTPSLFALLKTRPAIGRTFSDDDARIGAPKTVVLNDAFWRKRFRADPKIVGTEIRFNGEPYTVIGVMPPGFYFPNSRQQYWVPLAFTDQQKSDKGRGSVFALMVARLKPGATIEQAQREVSAIHKATADRLQFPPGLKSGVITNFIEIDVTGSRTMLWFVQGAVVAALLIGCTNVTSLLLARASARERELTIRAALGAGRGRLIRHVLTETLMLFLIGGLLGLLLASWGITTMKTGGMISTLPRDFTVSLDATVFGATLFSALVTGLVFGALPAWSAARLDTAGALRDAGARATTSRQHVTLRSALVVTQIALALMLAATAALLVKSFDRVQNLSAGFVHENVLAGWLALPSAKYDSEDKQALFQNALLGRVSALSGVTVAGCTGQLPFDHRYSMGAYQVEGYTPPPGQPGAIGYPCSVSPSYFRVMGIPLLRGRVFTEQDTRTTRDVVVIDDFFADRYWPGENPIGKRLYSIRVDPNNAKRQLRGWEVVGVVGTVKRWNLDAPVENPIIYFSSQQSPVGFFCLVAKTVSPPDEVTMSLRAAVQELDPDLPLFDVRTMDARISESIQHRRTPMILVALFAGIALLLAAIGVYGVLAFAVGQRTQEIGVRMALGATRANILQLILRQGVHLIALGLVLGLGGYFALSTVIRKLLFSVEPTDIAALLLAPMCLAIVALVACVLPANRATKVDPVVALRAE